MTRRYWLLKTEPEDFSYQDLARCPDQTTSWEGVRNYQARNLLRDEVRKGDGVLVYHSNADPPAVVGTAEVVREAYPDPFQFDRSSRYFDPQADPSEPRWLSIEIRYGQPLARPVPLSELREARALAGMGLLRRGNRLSVQPVTAAEWEAILKLGGLRVR